MPYTIYIDDSGTGGPLWDWNGQRITSANAQPVTMAAAVIVPDRSIREIEEAWNNLRQRIQAELEVDKPPTIHMRLMYGHTLPNKDRGQPNPYLRATPERRLELIEEALQIIDRYYRRGTLQLIGLGNVKDEWARGLDPYYSSDLFKAEYAYLRSKSAKALRAYQNVAANPHMDLMALMLFAADRLIKHHPDKRAKVVYDCNPDSRGLDVLTALQAIQASGYVKTIRRLEESDDRTSSLLQVADVCCYRLFRKKLLEYRNARLSPGTPLLEDEIMNRWAGLYPVRGFREALSKEELRHAITIRYEAARLAAARVRPDFAEKYLCTVAEFNRRSLAAVRAKPTPEGISVLAPGVTIP